MGKAGLLLVFLVLAVVGLVGYLGRSTAPASPNDVAVEGPDQAKKMRDQLAIAYEQLDRRAQTREIDGPEKARRIRDLASSFADKVDLEAVPNVEAFDYGEVFRTAERWREAQALFQIALQNAANDDLRVNASLRIAHCAAALGDFDAASRAIRATFSAQPGNKGGTLLATLYEVTPPLAGKGHDAELAKLLEEAIEQHRRTIIDPKTDAGQAFLMAMPTHVRNGWLEVIRLYRAAGRPDEAARAERDGNRMLASFARV